MTSLAPDLSHVGHELLDDPSADPELVALSLRNLARANRWLGGAAAVRFGLERILGGMEPGTRVSLLDIGTGAGDLPGEARTWAAARGLVLRTHGLDRSRVAARLATGASMTAVVGCLGALPVASAGVDVVLLSQVAHHLAPSALIVLIRDVVRIARRGVILCDLRRSALAAAGFAVVARLLRFDAATRHDGALSVRRGYHPRELSGLLQAAGVVATVHRRPGYRLVAAWRTD